MNKNILFYFFSAMLFFAFQQLHAQCTLTIDPDLSVSYANGCSPDFTLPGSTVDVTNPTTDNSALAIELYYDTDPNFDPYAGGGTVLTGYETGPFIEALPANTGCDPIIYYVKGAWINYVGTDCEAEATQSITSTMEVVVFPVVSSFASVVPAADPCVDPPTIDLGACAGTVTAAGPNGFTAGNTGLACWDVTFADPGVATLPVSCLTVTFCGGYTCLGVCPVVTDVTGPLAICEGDDINVSAVIDPAAAIENDEYFLEWYSNGTAIPNTLGLGADGAIGTGDDVSVISQTIPGTFTTDPGCGYEENQIEVSLFCMQKAELHLATSDDPCPSGTSPNCVHPYVAAGTCFDLDLSALPACALATEFFFNVQGVSGVGLNGTSYGNSYACEANIEVNSPSQTLNFCGSGAGTGCGTFNPGCDGTTGTGSWGNAETYTFGYPSTQAASGLWQICISDAFDDSGGGAEGEVQVLDLVVDWYLPPGCDINNGTTFPLTDDNGAPTPTRICADLVNGVDYTVAIGCTGEVTAACPDGGSAEVLYSADGSPGSYTSTTPVLNDPPADGDLVYYQVRIPGCDDCLVQATTALTACPVPCPVLQTATAEADNCDGQAVTLTATVDTGVENEDYFLVWYEDGVEILNGVGADGIPGTADDVSMLSQSWTLSNANGACGFEDHEYYVELYCLDAPVLDLQPTDSPCPSGTSPNCVYQYDPGPIFFNLDLTSLPACAITTSYDYAISGTTLTGLNGDNYGVSYACEMNMTVTEPAGSTTYCGTGAGTGCATFNPGCDGPTGAADYGTSGSGIFPFGTGPGASFNWGFTMEDAFDDGGIDGEIQTVFFQVNYYLPPGCDRNMGNVLVATNSGSLATTPANGGTADPAGADAGTPSGVRVCTPPVLATDFTEPAPGCDPTVTLVCAAYAGDPVNDVGPGLGAGAAILYSTDGGTTYTSTDPYDAVSITATDNSDQSDLTVEYQVFQPGCPACANVTGSFMLSFPADPVAVNGTICEGIQGEIGATGGPDCTTINWFSDMAGTTSAGTGATLEPADTAPGVYTYYAQCEDANGCKSALIPVTYTIFANPIPAFTCPAPTRCGGLVDLLPMDTNPDTAAGSTGAWSGSGASFVTADQFDPLNAPIGVDLTLTYTLTSADGCVVATECTFQVTNDCAASAGDF